MALRDVFDLELTLRVSYRNIILLALLSPLTIIGLFFILRSNGAPAWIQALGSVLAIVVAIVLAQNERRHRAELQRQERLRQVGDAIGYMEKSLSVAADGLAMVEMTVDYLSSNTNVTNLMLDHFDRLLTTSTANLAMVDAMRIDSNDAATAFIQVKRHVAMTKSILPGQMQPATRLQGWQLTQIATECDREWRNMSNAILDYVQLHPEWLDSQMP